MKEQFLTTNVVEVVEMSRKEYVESRGWELPENEKHLSDERVYKVFYPDGYISMCPKETFLKTAYKIEDNSIPEELVKTFIKRMDISTERVFGKLNTVVKYELINGFTGIESTSCMNESDYDEETGVNIIAKKLYDKIWFGLGFALGMTNKKGEEE